MNVSSGAVATGVTAAVAASVVAAVPALQTTVTIDVGTIFTALAQPFTIVTTAVVAWIALRRTKKAEKEERELAKKEAAKVAKANEEKLTGIHTLVNDQLTREKVSRLLLLKGHKAMMESVLNKGAKKNPEHTRLIESLSEQIVDLEAEIAGRDAAAATLTKAQL